MKIQRLLLIGTALATTSVLATVSGYAETLPVESAVDESVEMAEAVPAGEGVMIDQLPDEAIQEANTPGAEPVSDIGVLPEEVEKNAQATAPVVAVDPGTVINAITLIGNKRVERDTVLTFFNVTPGQKMTSSEVNAGLDSAFKSGLFADITADVEGDKLTIRLVENPIVNQVAFEGNKRIDDEELASEVSLAARSIYNKSDVQGDVQRILNLYQKQGRFAVEVNPKVIQLSDNRVDLVFEISEGEKTSIGDIVFIGNNAYGDDRLKRVVQTKETRWFRFLSSSDTYDPDRLAFDQELLRRFYVSKGYADFRVVSSNAELDPVTNHFTITYSIEEGEKYRFGAMGVTTTLKDVTPESLKEHVITQPEEIYNAEQIEKSIENITNHLGDQGYAFVQINPAANRDPENKIIGITYEVSEGPRVYVEKINVRGNVRTLDSVVRREFRFAEGDPYNSSKLKRSEQRIKDLDFFKTVKVDTDQGSEADRVNVNVDVEEKSTGELTIGAGFSSSDGALGNIGIGERNLLGKGQVLKLNFTLASVRQEVDLGFTEPYFMDREIAAGFDIFSIERDGNSARSNRTFDSETVGFNLRAAYPLTEHLTHSTRYSLKTDDITDIDEDASEFIRRQEGKNSTSLVGHALIYDKRDSKLDPTDGFFVRLNQDVAGLGGDARFLRHEVRGGYFVPVVEDDVVLRLLGRGGHVVGIGGEDVRINDRFFIGSNEIRGFDTDGVGPRDDQSRDPLGGNIYIATTAEVMFPIGLPEELGFKGVLFTDAGTLYDNDDDTATNSDGTVSRVLDDTSLRASIGTGVAWNSPFGPVRVDFAHAVAKEDYDETEIVRFSFGTKF